MSKLMEIEVGVPLPRAKETRYRGIVELFRRMQVGDCITIPYDPAGTVRSSAKGAGIRVRVKSSKIDNVTRVWRIA